MRCVSGCTGQARIASSTQKLAMPTPRNSSRDSTNSKRMPPVAANQITGGVQYRLIANSAITPRMLPPRLRL